MRYSPPCGGDVGPELVEGPTEGGACPLVGFLVCPKQPTEVPVRRHQQGPPPPLSPAVTLSGELTCRLAWFGKRASAPICRLFRYVG
ncbi:hypothetical protein RHIZ404_220218 [Rhizobium sp. EC-SD404]|nr:hypothetical protein RHIZ404_220218 [Rhizobium sp. EC-SD404]